MDITLDVPTLTLLVGTVVPFLVALVSKEVASSRLKGVLNAALSAVGGALVVLLDNGGTANLNELINAGVFTFITSVATYYGIWKPSGATAKVAEKTGKFGVGLEVHSATHAHTSGHVVISEQPVCCDPEDDCSNC